MIIWNFCVHLEVTSVTFGNKICENEELWWTKTVTDEWKIRNSDQTASFSPNHLMLWRALGWKLNWGRNTSLQISNISALPFKNFIRRTTIPLTLSTVWSPFSLMPMSSIGSNNGRPSGNLFCTSWIQILALLSKANANSVLFFNVTYTPYIHYHAIEFKTTHSCTSRELTWIDLSTLILLENDTRSFGKYSRTALTALIKLSSTGTTCNMDNVCINLIN